MVCRPPFHVCHTRPFRPVQLKPSHARPFAELLASSMGVQNLWVLLAPVGRQIEIESLAGQVLAVDASIWLTQFVKAMRDDEGNMIRNAHLMGTLYRVAKLLFFGVRPVFVFDGQTPEIKKRTTARRRKRQEQQSANLRHTAQRILLNRLRQQRQEIKKNGGAVLPAAAPGITLPGEAKKDEELEEKESDGGDGAEDIEEKTRQEVKEKGEEEKDGVQMAWDVAAKEEEAAGEDLTLEDIDLDTSQLSKIDLHAVFSLPAHLQKDMIQKILRDRRQEVRDHIIPLAGNPEKYSHMQISAFLQTSALNRRIAAAKNNKREEEIGVQGSPGLGKGHRIDSNSNRFYIYQKDGGHKKQEDHQVGEIDVTSSGDDGDDHSEKVVTSSTQTPSVSSLTKYVGEEVKSITLNIAAPASTQPHAVSSPSEIAGEKLKTLVPKVVAMIEPPGDTSIPGAKSAGEISDSDEDIEWEDVPPEDMQRPAKLSCSVIIDSSHNHEQPSDEEKRISVDAAFLDQEDVASTRQENEEGEDDLFLTLKSEMEEAKAHQDLDVLKDEALQSAMVTASNLTQWAAGAVRRALQAHSQQHGGRIGNFVSPGGGLKENMRNPTPPGKGTAEVPNKPADENVYKPSLPSSSFNDAEVVVISEDEEEDKERQTDNAVHEEEEDSREQLQAALAASIASEQKDLAEKSAGSRVRYLQYSQPVKALAPSPIENAAVHQEMDTAELQKEQLELKKLRGRQLRDTEGITDDMVAEVMALLRLFGVPFLVSPMEAEAQCAALEQLGLVDGVITDDSDIFPFGGQRVYKNIFHHQKFVEAFSARDIERDLGFSREQIIALALLLGSDYTDGVRGIGIVNATEIAAAYPGIEGLREFKEWVQEFDVAKEADRVASGDPKKKKKKKKKANKDDQDESEDSSDESDGKTPRDRFQRSHASARRRWELGDEFPSKQVVQAYMDPQVDRSEARFSWSTPDLPALRNYCANAFGWDQQKSDGVLQPLEEKAKASAASASRHIQTRLDRFFTSYDDQVHYAQIKSKRLRSAVKQRTGSKSKKQRK
ncbi:unnamed protein product [Phytophthora fragariaefolia]|uniref:Unnamed protein product n=1 Tax=Phytophthora fragariaefolia TaxID=1490495 RepID=A0A9W6Y505_9STRA|nr:unnamed protein product [Phytophthora fragariaefolia]